MLDILTSIVDAQVDYGKIFALIGVYLATLWFMFCLWVYVDARKRYNNFLVALIFCLVVLVFNFPALIFYLIVRPELEEWIETEAHEQIHGGVQVPIVHFTGEDGKVEMSLNLNLHPRKHPENDMIVDVKWDSDKDKLEVKGKQDPESKNSENEKKLDGKSKSEKAKKQGFMETLRARVNKLKAYMEKSRQEREKKRQEKQRLAEERKQEEKQSKDSGKDRPKADKGKNQPEAGESKVKKENTEFTKEKGSSDFKKDKQRKSKKRR